MLPNTKFLHSFGLTYVAYFWFDLFNSHHKQMGKLELNCDQIRKFYIMLMGGWGSICWVNTEEALPIVVLDKEDKCCRQICSTYFPQSSLFHCLEKRTQRNRMSMFDFFLPPWFVCGARFVWEKLGSVLIQESCVGLLSNNIERDTLWNISHTTQCENNVRKRINCVEVWCWNIIRGWYGWRDWK